MVVADLKYEAALETARQSEACATSTGFKALPITVDVTDRSSVDNMVNSTVQAFGRIDYNVNCAGVGVEKHLPVEDTDPDEMNRFWKVNVMGTLNCIQAVTKVMKEQSPMKVSIRGKERDAGRGVILNLGSCNSYMVTPHVTQYATKKHAVMGLTKNAGKTENPFLIALSIYGG